MKRIPLLLAAALTFSVTSMAQNNAVRQTSNTNETQPYKVQYNNLKFGKADYSKMILNTWKAYDDNRLDDIALILAENVKAGFADGSMVEGRANFMSGLKTYRGGFSTVSSTVEACTTLKSESAPDSEITLIWGMETATKKDGTVQKSSLHEVWFFNKDGMVTQFYQYAVPIVEKK